MSEHQTPAERLAEATGAAAALGRRSVGSPVLFAVIYSPLIAVVYFGLGVVADEALGLTPFVFLVGALFFGLAAMTYVEGASLHQDRAGSTVFARYAFNELWSFVAGWALILDYILLIALASFTATNYAGAIWEPLGEGGLELVLALGIIAVVAAGAIRGFSRGRATRLIVLVGIDLVLLGALVVIGAVDLFSWDALTSGIDLGTAPSWDEVLFALGLVVFVATGLESASGLAGETRIGRRGLRRLVTAATLTVGLLFVGVSAVALSAYPQIGSETQLATDYLEAPVIGITEAISVAWLSDALRIAIAIAGTLTLVEAAVSGMLGLSRLAYSLSTNRQIPSAVGRLHPERSTPFVVITIAAVLAGALVVPEDVDLLVGLYAFGALISLTIAHASIVALRFREPDRPRPYKVPFTIGKVPVPAALGGVLSLAAWVSVLVLHEGARYVGTAWVVTGLVLYVVYRRTQGKSIFKRVVVPESALRRIGDPKAEAAYGAILVPIMGTAMDDDIVQTAGRLAGEFHDDFEDDEGSVIEAIWVFEIPMSLPIDARLPDAQMERARAALRRAKAVGEEYQGVQVATATVRSRQAGQAIVEEARRRGVEAIVLAAEEPSRIRGGALLGGRAGGRDNFVGDVTKYVVAKAPCQVILTAPPSEDLPSGRDAGPADGG